MKVLSQIIRIAGRECRIMLTQNPIYFFSIIFLPFVIVAFFTTIMADGQPTELPVGVVDQDNTTTSRKLIRTLDSFQTSDVVGHYANINDARRAMQRGEIYAFLLIPKGTTDGMVSAKQPEISFYYNSAMMLAGSTAFRDMKTVALLSSAGIGSKKLEAIGKTKREIQAFLQPISIDLHMINNPWANYNIYLTTVMVPGLFMLLIFLVSAYSIGTELKFGQAREWMYMADGNPVIAIAGKFIPQTLAFLIAFYAFEFYIFHVLEFPHPGGVLTILLLGFVTVFSSQCLGIFLFGLAPSLRMSMTICSLLAMLGFSMAGSTFPVFAMDGPLQALAWIFPLRHYYMIYQINIFNGYPLSFAWIYWLALMSFSLLPAFVMPNIRRAMLLYKYMP